MDNDHDPIILSPSFKQKLKHSLPLSSCFSKSRPQPHPRLTRSSSGNVPDFKFKYCNFLSRNFGGAAGGYPPKHTRRHSAVDFSYDAMSYALNFDEGGDERDDDGSPFRTFASRLPRSPDRELAVRCN